MTTESHMESVTVAGESKESMLKLMDEELLQELPLTPEQKRQEKLEKEQRTEFIKQRQAKTVVAQQGNRASQTDGGRWVRYHLVPALADWLEGRDEVIAMSPNRAGFALKEYRRIKTWLSPETIAHITISTILDQCGRGVSMKARISTVQKEIGRRVEDEAMLTYIEEGDPRLYKMVKKYYLDSPHRRYDKKVYAAEFALGKSELANWDRFTDKEYSLLGSFFLRAAMSIKIDEESNEGFWCKKQPMWNDTGKAKKRKKCQDDPNYLVFTVTGLKYRDKFQQAADEGTWKPMPMVCKPLPWGLEVDEDGEEKIVRGGYITKIPGEHGKLIHGNLFGSKPSQIVLDAVNRLQDTGYKVNTYILDLMKELSNSYQEIGSWYSYEKLSYEEAMKPMYNSDYLDSLDRESDEYKATMLTLTKFYNTQKVDEQKAQTPRRTLLLAESFRDEPAIWLPWFLDTRGRCYPVVEGLSCQGTDHQKALLRSSVGVPINEDTERDLLITIATTGAFKVTPDAELGVDKMDFFTRFDWAYNWVRSEECKAMVEDPTSWKKWHDADEPWQFLSACKEWYDIFYYKTKDYCDVFCFRDATNSGLQILAGLMRDEKAARYTNVLIGDSPADAYRLVADTAKTFMRNEEWMTMQFDAREQVRIKKNQSREEPIPSRGKTFEFDIDILNRNHTKTQVMTTLYNSSPLTRRENILEALKKKDQVVLHPGDKGIVVKACIEAMSCEFERALELNKWFQKVAVTAMAEGKDNLQWVTPSGMFVVNEYREPLFIEVRTHAAGGGAYAKLGRDEWGSTYLQHGYGDVRASKVKSSTSANYIHSLDSSIIHLGVTALEEGIPFFSVHDCLAGVGGTMSKIVPVFRKAYLNVVTSNPLVGLLEDNGMDDKLTPPTPGNAPIEECLESPYMFC
jgi:DNA-directed RNA polymerase